MNKNTGWIIGLVVTIVIAFAGWTFGGLQTANAQTHGQIIDRVETNETDIKDIKTSVATLIAKMDILVDEIKIFVRK